MSCFNYRWSCCWMGSSYTDSRWRTGLRPLYHGSKLTRNSLAPYTYFPSLTLPLAKSWWPGWSSLQLKFWSLRLKNLRVNNSLFTLWLFWSTSDLHYLILGVHLRLNMNWSLTQHLCYILGFGKKACQANIQILQTKGSQKSVSLSTPRLLSRNSFCPTVFLPDYTLLCTATVIILNPLCVTYANVIFCTMFESSIIHSCFLTKHNKALCPWGWNMEWVFQCKRWTPEQVD